MRSHPDCIGVACGRGCANVCVKQFREEQEDAATDEQAKRRVRMRHLLYDIEHTEGLLRKAETQLAVAQSDVRHWEQKATDTAFELAALQVNLAEEAKLYG